MIAKGIAHDLSARGVTVVSMHPGWVRTRMGGQNAPVTLEQSVTAQQRMLEGLTFKQSGRFFNYDSSELPW
jgi:NAD(P)-dependent dehydrogenase (short-subunit alcohol dehydrogenase family)